jgi:transposase
MSAAELAALLELVLSGAQPLEPVDHSDTVKRKKPVHLADGYEVRLRLTASVDGQVVEWTERRLVIRSVSYAQRQAAALDRLQQQASAEIEHLNVRRQGKKRLSADQLRATAQAILQRRGVADMMQIHVRTTTTTTQKRKYGARSARVVRESQTTVQVHINPAAVAAAKARLGWQVYATNHPRLTLTTVVLAYRGQYVIEHGFGRLKGKTLSLTPLYLQRDDRLVGLIRLLTIGLRVLTLLAWGVRRQLENEGSPLKGLYAGNPQRATARPTAEAILRAFRGISLVVEHVDGHVILRLSPLNALQQRLLRLLGIPLRTYLRLTMHFLKPVPI